MTWLYVPGISSACAQGSEGLNSEYCLPSTISERLAEGSVTWRGKLAPPQAWSRRWKQGGYIRRLSGLTCSPSMLDAGVASFISSLRETPARTTALPGNRLEQKAQDSSRPKSAGSPRSAGLILSSARTCRGTLMDSLKPSSRHWKDWATALRQEYSARPKLAIPCDASDCSSWEAPSVAVVDGSRMTRGGVRSNELLLTGQAVAVASKWSSPKASDPEKAGPNMRGSKGDIPLPAQTARWAGPAAQNHKGSSEGSITRADGKSREDILSYQAEQFFRLSSSPDQPIAGGSMSSIASPNSNQPSAKRKLNPIFVEALMRWPTGLSGFERRGTAWIQWWQLMPSFLSALYSQKEDEQIEMF